MPTRCFGSIRFHSLCRTGMVLCAFVLLWTGYGSCFPVGTEGASPLALHAVDAKDDRPRIVAFGDSLTAGLGVGPQESYPAELQRLLDGAGYRYRVINAGVSGETSAGGLRRVPWILNSRPDIVILELGGNDGLRGLSPEDTKDNLDRIVRGLRDGGARVVLAGMKLPPNYGREYASRFEAIYPELAKKHRLTLIPFFLDGVAAQTKLNQPDGIHPTAEGHRIIAANVLKVVEPLLKK